MSDPGLKDFTAPADIFNLLFFVAAFGVLFAYVLAEDRTMEKSFAFVYALTTFKTAFFAKLGAELGIFFTVAVCLLGLLVAYIPLTHMSHFVGKYFAYHSIRWNDEPNLKGGKHEKGIGEVLNYPVSWAAPHIEGDGKKTWADVATVNPAEEQK
jgi:nitrate reductase gamma subunit